MGTHFLAQTGDAHPFGSDPGAREDSSRPATVPGQAACLLYTSDAADDEVASTGVAIGRQWPLTFGSAYLTVVSVTFERQVSS